MDDHVITFWILATCEYGALASAHTAFCLYCTDGGVFVNPQAYGPQSTSYHEYHCPRCEADLDPYPEAPRDDRSADLSPG